jgi:hypothetical protein
LPAPTQSVSTSVPEEICKTALVFLTINKSRKVYPDWSTHFPKAVFATLHTSLAIIPFIIDAKIYYK